jgi:predicted ATPase
MFEGLRLKNFRSLQDTGMVALKPITLLLGQNSSGKSTFLRSLPLIRQSIGTRSSSPILWYGDFVDFGSFEEVKSTFATNQNIGLSFYFGRLSLTNIYYLPFYREKPPFLNVTLGIELAEVDGGTKLKEFRVTVEDDEVVIALDSKGQLVSVFVNGADFSRSIPKDRVTFSLNDVVPQANIQHDRANKNPYIANARQNSLTEHEIFAMFSKLFDKRVSVGTLRNLARRIDYSPPNEFRQKIESLNVDLKSWAQVKTIILYSQGVYGIDHLRSLYLLGMLPDLLHSINQSLGTSFRSLSYVGPSRATGERYYRHQELAVDQIDPQGQNLAMYLYSLPTSQRDAFSSWLESEIGYALRVGRQGGHVQIELKERGAQNFHNLADMGYGFSQILPVMAQIWGKSQRRVGPSGNGSPYIVIEQPELHLHPAYQARIADVMASSINLQGRGVRRARFIVETHSEALINRLGELIFDGRISNEDVAIYLFHRIPSTDATEITRANFNKDGSLSDWPLGFFSSRVRG